MSATYRLLSKLKLNHFPILLYGWERGWVNENIFVAWACEQLEREDSSSPLVIQRYIARIAGGDLEDNTILEKLNNFYLNKQRNGLKYTGQDLFNIWRLVRIQSILEATLDEQQQVEKLQQIYADFDYPEDMKSISIYANDGIPPLTAAKKLVEKLMKELLEVTPQDSAE